MSDLFSNFSDWMAALPVFWAYVAVLAIAYGENVVPPVPGDLAVVFAGYLVGVGKLGFVPVVLLSTLGGALGFMTMYAIGYRIGDAVLDPNRLRWLPKPQIATAKRWLERWGYFVVGANRFLSGARSVISLTVGMAKMAPGKTAALATLSAFVWTLLITAGGYFAGRNWQVIGQYLAAYGRVVLVVTLLVVAVVAVRKYWARRSRRRGE